MLERRRATGARRSLPPKVRTAPEDDDDNDDDDDDDDDDDEAAVSASSASGAARAAGANGIPKKTKYATEPYAAKKMAQ